MSHGFCLDRKNTLYVILDLVRSIILFLPPSPVRLSLPLLKQWDHSRVYYQKFDETQKDIMETFKIYFRF